MPTLWTRANIAGGARLMPAYLPLRMHTHAATFLHMASTRKNFVLTDDDQRLLDRLQNELGWSYTDSVRLGLAALRVLLVEGDDRTKLGDGRQRIKLRLGDARSLTLTERKDGSGTFYIGMESPGPATRAGEAPAPVITKRFGP